MVTASVTHTLSLLQNVSISLALVTLLVAITAWFVSRSRGNDVAEDQTLADRIGQRIRHMVGEGIHQPARPEDDQETDDPEVK